MSGELQIIEKHNSDIFQVDSIFLSDLELEHIRKVISGFIDDSYSDYIFNIEEMDLILKELNEATVDDRENLILIRLRKFLHKAVLAKKKIRYLAD